MDAKEIKALLEARGIRPNKALGQNFLADSEAARAIARLAAEAGAPVLEIGPGLGSLTWELVGLAPHVTAVELDAAMADALADTAKARGLDVTIICRDFLKFDMAEYAKSHPRYCVAANLPYYITTPIIGKLISAPALPESMTLMMQREAAARFFAKEGTKLYSPLTVLSSRYYTITKALSLTPASYYPAPEVESTVLHFVKKEGVEDILAFPAFLNAAFSMRRKTLVNNLRALTLPSGESVSREEAERALASAGIALSARAEALTGDMLLSVMEALYSR